MSRGTSCDRVIGTVGIERLEFLQLVVHCLGNLSLQFQRGDLLGDLVEDRAAGIAGESQLLLDMLEFLAQEVLALVLLELAVDTVLDLLLHREDLLFLLDEDQDPFHPSAHVQGLEDPLLLPAVDIDDARDEIGHLPCLVDVHHVQPHLLGEQRIPLGEFFRLSDELARPRLHSVGLSSMSFRYSTSARMNLPLVWNSRT